MFSSRRTRKARRTVGGLLALVGIVVLAVAAPAVARPAHLTPPAGAGLSSAAMIALLGIAALAAVALVLVAVFIGEREPVDQAELAHVRHGRATSADRHRLAA